MVFIEPKEGPTGADVPLCTFESTNAGFSSFSVRDTSVLRVITVPLQDLNPASCVQL
jgi:hypothetical protein